MSNEPLKHHYIPQFILRNFNNSEGLLQYWDNENKYLSKRNTRSIFMNVSMYRSEEINEENPVEIENNLSKFEQEIAPIFKKLCSPDAVDLTRKELESLRIFLSLLSFRSNSRMLQYKDKKFNESTEEILKEFKGEKDFELFWKSEINNLSKCRTYDDVLNVDGVDSIIKLDFHNDLMGYYMTLLEARGQEFVISDIYPTTEIFPILPDTHIHLHTIYPISPTRAILLNHILFKKNLQDTTDPIISPMIKISRIKGQMIKEPRVTYRKSPSMHVEEDIFHYKPVKIYEDDVAYLNMLIFNETQKGFAFKDGNKIKTSLKKYNELEKNYVKNNFEKLEELLNKE